MRIESLVVCDDIRQEGNGKLMLIGVYDSDILLPKGIAWPHPMLLSFLCRLVLDDTEKFDTLAFRFAIENKTVAEGSGKLNITDPAKHFTIVQKVPMQLNPGRLTFEVTCKLDAKVVASARADYSLLIREVDVAAALPAAKAEVSK